MEHWSEYRIGVHEWWAYRDLDYYSNVIRAIPLYKHTETFTAINEYLKGTRIVAQKTTTSSKKTTKQVSTLEWLNISITDTDLPEIEEWLSTDPTDILGYVLTVSERGFNISLKPAKDDDYMCSIVGKIDTVDGERLIGLSAYAVSPINAVIGALYKFIGKLDWGNLYEDLKDAQSSMFR